MGELTELVPVPDFKSVVPWRESGKVSSILMLSRHLNSGTYGTLETKSEVV